MTEAGRHPVGGGAARPRLSGAPDAMGRRRFLTLGGWAASVGALAACGGRRSASRSPGPTQGTSTTETSDNVDISILRTASSIEHYEVGLYMEAAALSIVAPGAVLDIVRYFADQHSAHAAAFEGATARAGGRPFTEANPVLSRMATTRVAALRSQSDVLRLAYDVEDLGVATYVSSMGLFTDRSLNAQMMSIASTGARRVAVLGVMLAGIVATPGAPTPPYPVGGLASTAAAVSFGTGV